MSQHDHAQINTLLLLYDGHKKFMVHYELQIVSRTYSYIINAGFSYQWRKATRVYAAYSYTLTKREVSQRMFWWLQQICVVS